MINLHAQYGNCMNRNQTPLFKTAKYASVLAASLLFSGIGYAQHTPDCNPSFTASTDVNGNPEPVNIFTIQGMISNLVSIPEGQCASKTLTLRGHITPRNLAINKLYVSSRASDNLVITGDGTTVLDQVGILLDSQNVTVKKLELKNHRPIPGYGLNPIIIGASSPYGHIPDTNALPATNNKILNNKFTNITGYNIISISGGNRNNGNIIKDNTFKNWGASGQFTVGVRVGSNRLQGTTGTKLPTGWKLGKVYDANGNIIVDPDGSSEQTVPSSWQGGKVPGDGYVGLPIITGTKIEGNHFLNLAEDGFNLSNLHQYTVAVQLYNPSSVKHNVINGSGNGISTKGSGNTIIANTISNVQTDGALYLRDGHNNTFKNNIIKNNPNASGVWAWSSKFSLLENNVFSNNGRIATVFEASHNQDRADNWEATESPFSNYQPASLAGQTSHQFSAEKLVFLNNTFHNNTIGIKWHNYGPKTPNKRRDIYFINNIFWSDTSNSLKDNFSSPSDNGYNVYFSNNMYRSGYLDFEASSSVPTYYLQASGNDAISIRPFELDTNFTLTSAAQAGGLSNSSSLSNYPFGNSVDFSSKRGADLDGSSTPPPSTDFTATLNQVGGAALKTVP